MKFKTLKVDSFVSMIKFLQQNSLQGCGQMGLKIGILYEVHRIQETKAMRFDKAFGNSSNFAKMYRGFGLRFSGKFSVSFAKFSDIQNQGKYTGQFSTVETI